MNLQPPWTNIGALQQEIYEMREKIRGKAESYEVYSINSRLDGLERTVGEIRAVCDGLVTRFETEIQALRESTHAR